jgi:hypothetical protein
MQAIFIILATLVFGLIAAAGGYYTYLGFSIPEPRDENGWPIGWTVGAFALKVTAIFTGLTVFGLVALFSKSS